MSSSPSALETPRGLRVAVANIRMSNKRIRKKHVVRREAALSETSGEVRSLYEPRRLDVAIPCPSCSRFTLTRTYLPALGTMNGTVDCRRCDFHDQYVHALAV